MKKARLLLGSVIQLIIKRISVLEKPALFTLAIIVFVSVNMLSRNISARFDASQNSAYTLSESSKKIISEIDDVITISFFLSSDIPTRLLPLKTDVLDFLSEYERYSNKIEVHLIDPKADKDGERHAQELGISPLQFSEIAEDAYNVTSSYFGIAVQYGDKAQVIPQAVNIASLEYDITSAIFTLTREKPLTLAVVGMNQIPGGGVDEYRTIREVLEKQFQLDYISLPTSSEEDGEDVDNIFSLETDSDGAIFIIDGGYIFSENDLESIRSFLKEGGGAIFLVDNIRITQNLDTSDIEHGFDKLLIQDGISLEKNLVLSANSTLVPFNMGSSVVYTQYPFWVKTSQFNNDSSLFSNIGEMIFPWVSSISLKKSNSNSIIVYSEKKSWIQEKPYSLIPNNISQPSRDDIKTVALVAQYKGGKEGNYVVIPTTRFIKESFLTRGTGNIEFILNVANQYTSGGALAGIRNRQVEIVALKSASPQEKQIIKIANIIGFPALFSFVGALYLYRRKKVKDA